jgi:hypothetical protein
MGAVFPSSGCLSLFSVGVGMDLPPSISKKTLFFSRQPYQIRIMETRTPNLYPLCILFIFSIVVSGCVPSHEEPKFNIGKDRNSIGVNENGLDNSVQEKHQRTNISSRPPRKRFRFSEYGKVHKLVLITDKADYYQVSGMRTGTTLPMITIKRVDRKTGKKDYSDDARRKLKEEKIIKDFRETN